MLLYLFDDNTPKAVADKYCWSTLTLKVQLTGGSRCIMGSLLLAIYQASLEVAV